MKNISSILTGLLLIFFTSCESSDDISKSLDHEVPSGTSLTLSSNGQSVTIPDSIISKLLWGVVPEVNLAAISLPTLTVSPGSTVDISIDISDNDALATADLSYSDWLYSKYINFANPEGDIPLKPKSYKFTAQVTVPSDAVTEPWLETFYYNDGSTIKYSTVYHQLTLTLVDVNMNERKIPVFLKVE